MKRTLSFRSGRETALVVAGTGLIAACYGLVRLAYGLFLPDVQASTGLGSSAAGHVSSGASLAYCVGALTGTTARTRARLLVVVALATAAFGCGGMALAQGPALFAASAVLASIAAGVASPALVEIVARNVDATAAPRAQAVVNSGTGPGLVAAGLLALVLLPDWRTGVVVGGAVTALAAVAVLVLDRAPVVRRQEGPAGPGGARWLGALVAPALGALLLGTASAVVWTFGRTRLEEAGASSTASTWAWIALGLGGALTVATAALVARTDPARAWLGCVLTVAAATAVLGTAADRTAAAVGACLVFGWGFVAATSTLIAWTGVLAPERVAAGTSLLFVVLVLGQAIGSSAAGELASRAGLATAFVAMAAVGVAAAAVGWRPPGLSRSVQRRPRAPAPEGSG
ncbi:MFS transporter [Nocardioides flavescens]|uniref:YbfB/YjiJ family MFS transporter n=1 Tax=Nocardioides flavescens TaxID=2691959 RepID=A0A6L7F2C8_9ACTN|nr:MFS transporter [Nocardioides flavescens]MXG89494.1 YbfB/YjiJ family MFS transporter [Nocardioides flavescens]